MQHRIGSTHALCALAGNVVKYTNDGGRTFTFGKVSYRMPKIGGGTAHFLCSEVIKARVGTQSRVVAITDDVFKQYDFYPASTAEARGKKWSDPCTT